MIALSPADEERARRLHRESTVFICHDHQIFPENFEAMTQGGVTGKQLMISLDARVHADRETFLASARGRGYGREAVRHERPLPLADDEIRVHPLGPTESEGFLRSALVAMDYVYWQVERSGGRIRVALAPDDIRAAKAEGAVALVLGSEGSRLIEDRVEVLRMLYRLGLRHLQLSWALETTVGAPQSDRSGRGLTEFGKDLIRELNRLGVIVDVSHLADRSQYDALAISSTPVLNSHTGASALNSTQPQLLDDDLIKAFAAQGGVMAMHFHSQVVKPGRHQAKFDQLMAQFEHVARLAGTDHVACGPDYGEMRDSRLWENQGITTPFTMTEGVEDITKMLSVTRGLVSRGFSDDDIRKIMGGNLLRLFESVHAARSDAPWSYPRPDAFGAATGGTSPL
jgi:membrane dipeptidase